MLLFITLMMAPALMTDLKVNDGERRNLVGGQSNVTLTDSAAERRPDRRKSVAVRYGPHDDISPSLVGDE